MHVYEKKVFIMFTLILVTIYMTCYNEFKPVPLGFCLYSVYALNQMHHVLQLKETIGIERRK